MFKTDSALSGNPYGYYDTQWCIIKKKNHIHIMAPTPAHLSIANGHSWYGVKHFFPKSVSWAYLHAAAYIYMEVCEVHFKMKDNKRYPKPSGQNT